MFRNYLELMVELPWSKTSSDTIDIVQSRFECCSQCFISNVAVRYLDVVTSLQERPRSGSLRNGEGKEALHRILGSPPTQKDFKGTNPVLRGASRCGQD